MPTASWLRRLRQARGSLILVADEFGVIQGLVTTHDLLEAIVGELPDEDETPDMVRDGEGWLINGSTNIHQIEQTLGHDGLVSESDEYVTLAGMLLSHFGSLPTCGQQLRLGQLCFEVLAVSERRIERVLAGDQRGAMVGLLFSVTSVCLPVPMS